MTRMEAMVLERVRPARLAMLIVGFWFAIWCIDTVKDLLIVATAPGGTSSIGQVVFDDTIWWMGWLALSPLLVMLTRTVPVRRVRWHRAAAMYLVGE